MNDFTKEELLALYNIIKYGVKLEKDVVEYLSDKIQSMIENYCDPNCQHEIDAKIKACKLCGLPSHSIPCVGGWI